MLSEEELEKIPCGNSDFNTLRELGCIYVDKTDLIYDLTREKQQPVFLSRPRRFGKSLLLSAIDSWFRFGKRYFSGLKIENKPEENDGLSVLHLDFSTLGKGNGDDLEENFCQELLLKIAISGRQVEIPSAFSGSPNSIIKYYLLTAKPKSVVLLIDEYDDVLIDCLDNKEALEKALEIYRAFFKVVKSLFSSKIRFCMLTGVAKFSQASIFSGFNTIYDCTFIDKYAALTGFTREELELYFKPYIENLAESYHLSYEETLEGLTAHYDGFCFDLSGVGTVYNPWSVLYCLKAPFKNKADRFDAYWSNTAGLNTLTDKYFKVNLAKTDLADTIDKLSELTGPIVFNYKEASKPADYTSIALSTLLLQTGYLTIRDIGGKLFLTSPNEEVSSAMTDNLLTYLKPLFSEDLKSRLSFAAITKALNAHDPEQLCQRFNEILAIIGPDSRAQIFSRENIIRDILALALCTAGFLVSKEVEDTVGRADLMVMSLANRHSLKECSIFEFKRLADSTSGNREAVISDLLSKAQEQMLAKRYADLCGIGTVPHLYATVIDAEQYCLAKIVKVSQQQ